MKKIFLVFLAIGLVGCSSEERLRFDAKNACAWWEPGETICNSGECVPEEDGIARDAFAIWKEMLMEKEGFSPQDWDRWIRVREVSREEFSGNNPTTWVGQITIAYEILLQGLVLPKHAFSGYYREPETSSQEIVAQIEQQFALSIDDPLRSVRDAEPLISQEKFEALVRRCEVRLELSQDALTDNVRLSPCNVRWDDRVSFDDVVPASGSTDVFLEIDLENGQLLTCDWAVWGPL